MVTHHYFWACKVQTLGILTRIYHKFFSVFKLKVVITDYNMSKCFQYINLQKFRFYKLMLTEIEINNFLIHIIKL